MLCLVILGACRTFSLGQLQTSLSNNKFDYNDPVSSHTMPTFGSKPFPSAAYSSTTGARYRRYLTKYPFVLFGLPFIATIVAGSFFLTPATAVRYERFDRKTHMLDKDEALGLGRVKEGAKRRGKSADIREEYWVSALCGLDAKPD